MHKFRILAKKGEGTFSEVLKAQNIVSGEYCAIKCMRTHFRSIEQVNALREVQALRRLTPHPHVVDLYEVLYDKQSGRLALVFELMQCNVYDLIRSRKQPLPNEKVKLIMYQLLKSVAHMHRHGIFHRDIKPENVLVSGDVVKVADLGSCRGIHTRQPFTEYISTRWYRAPECLLTSGHYDHCMDIWGCACLFFEILTLKPLFPGSNELDQIDRIHSILGSPPLTVLQRLKAQSPHLKNLVLREYKGTGLPALLQGYDPMALNLLESMLAYDPSKRCTAKQALKHPYFQELRDAEKNNKLTTQSIEGTAKTPHGTSDAGKVLDKTTNMSIDNGSSHHISSSNNNNNNNNSTTTNASNSVITTKHHKSNANLLSTTTSKSQLDLSPEDSSSGIQATPAAKSAGKLRAYTMTSKSQKTLQSTSSTINLNSNPQQNPGVSYAYGGLAKPAYSQAIPMAVARSPTLSGQSKSPVQLRSSAELSLKVPKLTPSHPKAAPMSVEDDDAVPEDIEALPSVFERDPRASRTLHSDNSVSKL